jgi:hypothetical protein
VAVSGFELAFRVGLLAFEAQNVAVMRLIRLAAGGMSNQAEVTRMISEKVAAFAEAQMKCGLAIATGHSPEVVANKAVRILSKRVKANRRRLSKR